MMEIRDELGASLIHHKHEDEELPNSCSNDRARSFALRLKSNKVATRDYGVLFLGFYLVESLDILSLILARSFIVEDLFNGTESQLTLNPVGCVCGGRQNPKGRAISIDKARIHLLLPS